MSEHQRHCEKCGGDEGGVHWYPHGGYYECYRCWCRARAARKKDNGYYGDDRRKGEQTNGEQLKLKSFD